MKKGGFLILGLIALLLVGGLALVGCGRPGCDGDGMCSVKDQKGSICTNVKCGVWAGMAVDKELECDC